MKGHYWMCCQVARMRNVLSTNTLLYYVTLAHTKNLFNSFIYFRWGCPANTEPSQCTLTLFLFPDSYTLLRVASLTHSLLNAVSLRHSLPWYSHLVSDPAYMSSSTECPGTQFLPAGCGLTHLFLPEYFITRSQVASIVSSISSS